MSVSESVVVPGVSGTLDHTGQVLFSSMLLSPRRHLQRVQERIQTVDATTLRREVEFGIDLTPDSTGSANTDANLLSQWLVLPLLWFAKDRLINDRPLVCVEGAPVRVMNRKETAYLQGLCIELVVAPVLDKWVSADPSQARQDEANEICSALMGIPAESPSAALATYSAIFQGPSRPVERPSSLDGLGFSQRRCLISVSESAREALRSDPEANRICKRFTTHECMFVILQVPCERWVTLRLTYDSLLVQRSRTIRTRLRRRMGCLPHQYRISTPLAFQADSYHIRMEGPSDHYVWEQSFRTQVPEQTKRRRKRHLLGLAALKPPEGGGPALLGLPTRPNSEAHLYSHRMRDIVDGGRDLHARFVFFEKPPGLQGLAALLSGVTAAVLIAFLFVLSDYLQAESQSVDIAALVLLAPGVAAALIMPPLTGRVLQQGPAGARLSLLFTSLSALGAATLLAAVGASLGGGESSDVPVWVTSLWCILIACQLAFFLRLTYRYFRNERWYSEVLRQYSAKLRKVRVTDVTSGGAMYDDVRGVDIYDDTSYNFIVNKRKEVVYS